MSKAEDDAAEYYDNIWRAFVVWWEAEKTLGLHDGMYEKGVKSFEEAVYNLNEYVGKLLGLNNEKKMEILDAGCGVGGTSIYLAKKYQNVNFTGVTVSPVQIKLAKNFAKERHANNAKFILKSYLNTGFPDSYFDGVFAIESVCYAESKKDFIHEMNRVLKPGGKLVIISGIRTVEQLNPLMQKVYESWRNGRGKPDLPYIESIKFYLKTEGFGEIDIRDISKNMVRSQFRGFMIGLPYVVSSTFKRILKFGKYDPTKDPDYFLAVSSFGPILGLSKSFQYDAIKATKK